MSVSQARRALIRELVADRAPATQAELLDLLEEAGVPSTQPVLSRDLRALGVVKRQGAYALPGEDHVTPLEKLAALLRGAEAAGPHMVVVHSEPGAANAIARAFEAENPDGVVGTIAGDYTVFVAVDAPEAGAAVIAFLQELL